MDLCNGLILFGFKGCGKTHFGKLLAQKLYRPFLDTDDLLVELYETKTHCRLTPRAIYQKIGEASFRALEKEALFRLKESPRAIAAIGGGAVLDPDNVAFLKRFGPLVYLAASPRLLRTRVFREGAPAFLDAKDSEGSFIKVLHARLPLYEAIPARRIDIDALDEAGVLAALLEEVNGL